jgi:hypothetical protein
MTLQLTLPAPLEERLHQEAERQGLSADAVTLKLLDAHLPPANRASSLVAMFKQWQAEDEAMTKQECDANAEVLRAIDEDRLSDRKLFLEILKDHPA